MNNNYSTLELSQLQEQFSNSSFGAFIFNMDMEIIWINDIAKKTCPYLTNPLAFDIYCTRENTKLIIANLKNNIPESITFEGTGIKAEHALLMPSSMFSVNKNLFIGMLTPSSENKLFAYDYTAFAALSTVFREALAVSFANIYNLRRKGVLLKDNSDIQYADVLYRNCCSMFRAVQNVSSYYKSVSGLMALNKRFNNLNKFLSELCQSILLTYTENIHIELTLPSTNILCCFDNDKLATVLLNLISNGCLFNEHAIPTIHIILKHSQKGSTIIIKDDGVGVPGDLTEEIFLPFVSYSTKREKPYRLGLGLTLTKIMILAHKGTVTLESEEGIGTTVTLFLPSLPDEDISEFANTPALDYSGNQLSPVCVQLSDSFHRF